MTEKRKFNTLFPTLILGAGGRPTYFKMGKNVKSLIIFARDCLRWSCLGVSCPKFEILPNSSDQVDMQMTYFHHLNECFLSPKYKNSARRLRGELGKNKEAFLTNLIFLLSFNNY
jgi:hypothetical protein